MFSHIVANCDVHEAIKRSNVTAIRDDDTLGYVYYCEIIVDGNISRLVEPESRRVTAQKRDQSEAHGDIERT